jgi:hypothetical protein
MIDSNLKAILKFQYVDKVLCPSEHEAALKTLRLTHCGNVCSCIPFATLLPSLETLDLSFVDDGALSLKFFELFKPHPIALRQLHLFGLVAGEWDSRGPKFVQIFEEKYGTVISGVDSVRQSPKTALGRESAWNSMLMRQVFILI